MTLRVSDRHDARVQRSALAVAAVASKFTPILIGTAMAVYIGRRRGSPLAVSLVLAVYFLGLMAFAPVWGALADTTGRRRDVLLVVSGLAAVAALPLVVVDGVWLPLTVRTVYAAFAAGYLLVMLAIVSERGGPGSAGGRSASSAAHRQSVHARSAVRGRLGRAAGGAGAVRCRRGSLVARLPRGPARR